MANILLRLTSGRQVEFELDTGLEGPAYFVLSLVRSGSTFLNKIVKRLAEANQLHFINVGDVFFDANVTESEYAFESQLNELLRPGNVYGGFHVVPAAWSRNPCFISGPKFLQVRDPRDALVSRYFSDAYSHQIPDATGEDVNVKAMMEGQRAAALSMTVDEYVLQNATYAANAMFAYQPLLRSSNLCWIRYEDYIFDKPSLISRILEHFDWQADDALIARIMSWADVLPKREEPENFVRRVTPGDYLEKLTPRTIAILNQTLQPAMEPFGYRP